MGALAWGFQASFAHHTMHTPLNTDVLMNRSTDITDDFLAFMLQ